MKSVMIFDLETTLDTQAVCCGQARLLVEAEQSETFFGLFERNQSAPCHSAASISVVVKNHSQKTSEHEVYDKSPTEEVSICARFESPAWSKRNRIKKTRLTKSFGDG